METNVFIEILILSILNKWKLRNKQTNKQTKKVASKNQKIGVHTQTLAASYNIPSKIKHKIFVSTCLRKS